MNIIVAGGGIGGLSTALCLQRAGHQVTVIEQAQDIREVGAGIQLSPNCTRVLRELELLDDLELVSFNPEHLEMRNGHSGRRIFSIPASGDSVRHWGAPYLHIHRADLIEVLLKQAANASRIDLHTGIRVCGYEQDKNKVSAILDNGDIVAGDVLIGADGIHSEIRHQMLGADTPRFTGNVAWRLTVPVSKLGTHRPPPTACVWTGPARHAVTYLINGGKTANLVAVTEQNSWDKESWTERGSQEELQAEFENWHPVITTLIEQASTHLRWALFDRPPLRQWCDGRVALLGDACHPTLPFLAQGAAMAIEDAWVLSQTLSTDGKPEDQLSEYHQIRSARTARVQKHSLANMKTFHRRSRISQLATYGPMWLVNKISPAQIRARLDWLYRYDVLSEMENL